MNESFSKMFKVRLNEYEKLEYEENKVPINKGFRQISKEVKRRAKRDTCYVCGATCKSFCNSHTVPQFCLKRIANNGLLYTSGLQKEFPLLGSDTGVTQAGTFHIICNTCDGTIFQEYENPNAYSEPPSPKMLAQIAMKNYLRYIYKRQEEFEIYSVILERSKDPEALFFASQQFTPIKLDLKEYEEGYSRAKIAASGKHDDWYYMFFYKKLDYVVPIAFQGAISLISGFDGEIINNIYNFDSSYQLKDLHISVFPLKNETVIFAFIDSRDKVYRNFYKRFCKLPLDDQLATINYILFSNSEDVFISKTQKINDEVLTNRAFLDVCQTTNICQYDGGKKKMITTASECFSLSNRNNIPNLLSEEFALESE